MNPFAGWSDGKNDACPSAGGSTQAPSGSLTPGSRSLLGKSGQTTPGSRTPTKGTSAEGSNAQAHWEADATNCFRCEKVFNRAKMINRHHCRICGKNVCGKCSPSSLQLAGWPAPQRVCTTCASVTEQASQLKERVLALSQQLYVIHDPQAIHAAAEAETLDEAIAFCEGAVLPLKVCQTRTYRSLEDLGKRLNSAAGVDVDPPLGRSTEAVVNFCEAASEALEDQMFAKQEELERERSRADNLEDSLRSANQKVIDAQAALTEKASFRRTISQTISPRLASSGSAEANAPPAFFGSDPQVPMVQVSRKPPHKTRQEGKTCVNDKCCVM